MLDGVVGSNFLVVIQEGNFRSFAIRQKVVGARPQQISNVLLGMYVKFLLRPQHSG